MGLFDKLFAKKEKEPENPKKDEITIDTAYGKLYYETCPESNDYGYEGQLEWPTKGKKIEVYIETDSPETTEAGRALARLERLFEDRDDQNERVISTVGRFLESKPELNYNNLTGEEIMDESVIWSIDFYRNGDTMFSIDYCKCSAIDITLTFKGDGTREISYNDFDSPGQEKYSAKL